MAIDIFIKQKLYLDTLPSATQKALLACGKMPFFQTGGWYLAGGTALALQVGHRQSVDLDFFTTKKQFDELAAERTFFNTHEWQTTMREEGTIYGVFHNAKISLISYPFFIPGKDKIKFGTIKILKPDDIAAMKIIAISQRGRKRDFYDLYWYCKNKENLKNVILRSLNQYPGQEHNVHHIFKSIVYFQDAEADPEPKIFFKASWKEIKKYFTREAKTLVKEIF